MPNVKLPDEEIVVALTEAEFRELSSRWATVTPQEIKRLWATAFVFQQNFGQLNNIRHLWGKAIACIVHKHGHKGRYGVPSTHMRRLPDGLELDFALSKDGDIMFTISMPKEKIVLAREVPKR